MENQITRYEIKTIIEVPQDVCQSPILLILNLVEALNPVKQLVVTHVQGLEFVKTSATMINQQYSDDIGWVISNKHQIDE